jgi:hypothetical protein
MKVTSSFLIFYFHWFPTFHFPNCIFDFPKATFTIFCPFFQKLFWEQFLFENLSEPPAMCCPDPWSHCYNPRCCSTARSLADRHDQCPRAPSAALAPQLRRARLLPWLRTSLLAVKMGEKEKCQKLFFKMLKHFLTKFWSTFPCKMLVQSFFKNVGFNFSKGMVVQLFFSKMLVQDSCKNLYPTFFENYWSNIIQHFLKIW